jgi:hypothetical protein
MVRACLFVRLVCACVRATVLDVDTGADLDLLPQPHADAAFVPLGRAQLARQSTRHERKRERREREIDEREKA